MLWTAPPRHESAIEVGAVRTSHDSEQPGHTKEVFAEISSFFNKHLGK
jgi:hypothetical protein